MSGVDTVADLARAPPPLAPEALRMWLAQAYDLLALTDAAGSLVWANPSFQDATGLGADARYTLSQLVPRGREGDPARAALAATSADAELADTELSLRALSGATLRLRARTRRAGAHRLWTLHLVNARSEPESAARALRPAVAQPASAAALGTAAQPAVARRRRSGQLLYIEDNQVNVLLVEQMVAMLDGLRIASEPTGAAGVARALSLRPDLILVDLQLPDFDGFEVLRRLRAEASTAATPCIALSGDAMPDDIARGLAAGFDDYWTKPIDLKALLAALARLFPLPPLNATG